MVYLCLMNRKKRELYVQEATLANVCRNAALLMLSKGWSICDIISSAVTDETAI